MLQVLFLWQEDLLYHTGHGSMFICVNQN